MGNFRTRYGAKPLRGYELQAQRPGDEAAKKACVSRFVLQGRKAKIIKITLNKKALCHPERWGVEQVKILQFDLLCPQFLWMAWNPG